jgi:hypothetical protein
LVEFSAVYPGYWIVLGLLRNEVNEPFPETFQNEARRSCSAAINVTSSLRTRSITSP